MPRSSVSERVSNVKDSVEKGVKSAAVLTSPTLIPMQIGVVGSIAKGMGAVAGFFASVLWSFFVPGQIDGKGKPVANSSLEAIHEGSSWFARTWRSPWNYGWDAGVEFGDRVMDFVSPSIKHTGASKVVPKIREKKPETGQTVMNEPKTPSGGRDVEGAQYDKAFNQVSDKNDDGKMDNNPSWVQQISGDGGRDGGRNP